MTTGVDRTYMMISEFYLNCQVNLQYQKRRQQPKINKDSGTVLNVHIKICTQRKLARYAKIQELTG
jgi:hypothetical protein